MMDARLVWDTWRRILADDDLVGAVLASKSIPPIRQHLNLTAEEIGVLEEYSKTPAATNTNIGMYRRGLIRNALGALNFTPLSRRMLSLSSLDDETVAADFVRSIGYIDEGPNFWTIASRFVEYLATLPSFSTPPKLDVLKIDSAAATLARRLGVSAPKRWPAERTYAYKLSQLQTAPTNCGPKLFIATPAATVVTSDCDVTAWLENPGEFDPNEELEPLPCHWLIYFPTTEALPEYAKLSFRSKRLFESLSTCKTFESVSRELGDMSDSDLCKIVNLFAELGVISEDVSL